MKTFIINYLKCHFKLKIPLIIKYYQRFSYLEIITLLISGGYYGNHRCRVLIYFSHVHIIICNNHR